jgi:hypothetical protein
MYFIPRRCPGLTEPGGAWGRGQPRLDLGARVQEVPLEQIDPLRARSAWSQEDPGNLSELAMTWSFATPEQAMFCHVLASVNFCQLRRSFHHFTMPLHVTMDEQE